MVDKQARKSKHGTILFEPFILPHPPPHPPPRTRIHSPLAYLSMSSDNETLSTVTRSKLHLAVGGGSRDNCSLHRWVLLKNSILRAQPSLAAPACSAVDVNPVYNTYSSDDEEDDDDDDEEEHDSFMFPDAGKLATGAGVGALEEQWFDSLMETLEDVDESDVTVSVLPVDDDDDDDDYPPFTPSTSPMSSSDNLVYYDPPIAMPYPVVYPPYHPPLIHDFHLNSPLDSSYPPLDVALPYYDADDVDDLPVPDAIEDDSDDESDALSTPSILRSTASSIVDSVPSSFPFSHERARRPSSPQVYVDSDPTYFSPFELAPLPFPEDHHNIPRMYNGTYTQEC
ncbi:hypothetical protein OF83DRAFT_1275476 [Amylostereum chailletii]|nr:hypothetical protein OF83DRAFT_1275476 [Amylostereum chailletii]